MSSLFEEKNSISSSEIRGALENASSGLAFKIGRDARMEIYDEFFSSCGEIITKEEFERVLREIRTARYRAKASEEKTRLNRILGLLKALSGITDF